jgi:AcrR family transcriptional regulator
VSTVKRPYVAPLRAASARATRRAVVKAARDLFCELGWAATTVSLVANRAGVSRPTVFAVGSKAELLSLARDLAMAGDDEPVAVAERASFQRILTATEARTALSLFAQHVTALQSRYAVLDGVLQQASGTGAELRSLWQTSEQQRRTGAEVVVDSLNHVRLTREVAVDVLWVLMASEPYRRLVLSAGWSTEAYATWLSGMMRAELLGVR